MDRVTTDLVEVGDSGHLKVEVTVRRPEGEDGEEGSGGWWYGVGFAKTPHMVLFKRKHLVCN